MAFATANSQQQTPTAKRVDPYASFKFHVEIEGIKEAAFTECSGLEITTDVFEYQEGGLNEYSHKLPGRTKLSNISLKQGFATSNELFKWYLDMQQSLLKGKAVTRKKVTITLMNPSVQGETTSWTLQDAFPVKWRAPVLNTQESALAIEHIEFAHHGITLG
jgi:phage tail-like protein